MKIKSIFLFVAFVGVACLFSCTKDHTAVPAVIDCSGIVDTANTYSRNISVIMDNYSCTQPSCHGGGSAQFGVDLTSYASTVTAFQSQNVICTVTSGSCGGARMPLGLRPLDSATIRQLQCWQQNGYPQ